MKQFYFLKPLMFSLTLMALSLGVNAQTTYDWQTTAPDGNWKQGIANGPRWNPGGLWDEPPSTSATRLRFNNNTFPTMTNNSASSPYIIGQLFFGSSATTARTLSGGSLQFFEFGATWPRIENQSTTLHTFNIPFTASSNSGFNMELVASSGSINFGSAATINNNGRTIQIYGNNTAVDGTNRAIRLSGVVSGTGVLNVSQFGVVKLNAAHTYTGQTQIDNGELWIESAGSIAAGSGIFVGNGGVLTNVAKLWISDAAGGTTFTNALTVNNGNANTRYLGGLNTSGTHTFSGNITNNSITGGLNLSALNSGGTTAFTGVISGSSNIISEGAGTVRLSGANTYTGTTTVNSGTLQMGAANSLPATTAVITADVAGANLSLNNFNQSIVSLAGGGFSGGHVNLGTATLSITGTANTTFSGDITGTGNIIKSGTGILTLNGLTGTIGYTGTTTISGGQLRINIGNLFGLTMSTNMVMAGGTLSTSGISAGYNVPLGTLNMTANSTIALGTNAHSLTFANSSAVNWTSGTTLIVTGWTGSYNGTSGTAGKIYAGSDATGLTTTQLAQILFFNGINYYSATIRTDGEVVPAANIAMFWGGTAAQTWTSATWGIVNGGPYTNAWVANRGAIFNVAASTITGIGSPTNFSYITANENVTVTAGGTLGTNGTVAPIFVASGKTFNFQGQALSTAAGTGFIKNGPGNLLSASGTAGCLPAGVTLNSGLLGWGGVNGFGNGALTINGGVLSADGSARSPNTSSIVVNANFQFGDAVNYAAGSGNLTFSAPVNLGSSVTRTITLGRASTYSLNGIISGASSNLVLAATAAGTLSLGAANTYGGTTTINGGTLTCNIAAALPSTTGVTLANTAGAILNINGFAQSIVSLSGGGATGGNITLGAGTLTVNQSSNTTYSGLISGTGNIIKTGSGILTLGHTANTFTGTTTITNGELRLNPSTTTASYASQVVLNGGKLSTTGIAATTVFTSSSTLNLNANSSIDLGSNAHDLKFANSSGVTWAGTTLTINGWTGTAGFSGTAGRIFFGSGIGTLLPGQLSKITFTGFPGTPILLGTGELVPPPASLTFTWDGSSSSDWNTGANWDLNTVPTSTDNVVIPTAASYLNALDINTAVTCYDFTVSGTGTYNISAGASLTVNGAFSNTSSVAATYHCTSTLTIASSGSATIPAANYGNLNIAGGARVLANGGTISVCGNYTPAAAATTVTNNTFTFNGTTAQNILTNNTSFNLLNISNTSATVTSAVSSTHLNTMTIDAGAVYVQSAGTMTINAATTSNVNGTLRNTGGTITNSGTLNFLSGSTYDHARDAGAIPSATWNAASTLSVTGTVNTAPTNLNQSIGNFTWNTPALAATAALTATNNPTAINGAWSITNTNNNIIDLTGINRTYTCNLTMSGNSRMSLNRGAVAANSVLTVNNFDITAVPTTVNSFFMNNNSAAGATSSTFTVNGNLTINAASGTPFFFTTGFNTQTAIVQVAGNFTHTSGTIGGGGATSTNRIRFINAGTKNYSSVNNLAITLTSVDVLGGTLNIGNNTMSPTASFSVSAGAGITFGASGLLNNTGTFSLASTANLTTAHVGGIAATGSNTGCVQSSSTRTYNPGANYTFNPSSDGVTGTGLTGAATLNIATTAGANITLSVAATVTTTVNLQSGVLVLNTGTLTLGTTATFTGSPWSTSNMVVTSTGVFFPNRSPGRVLKLFPGTSGSLNFTCPLGDLVGTPEYSPVTMTGSYTGASANPYIAFKCIDSKHPLDPSVGTYLTRFWPMISGTSFGPATFTSFTVACTYLPVDVVGTEALLKMNRFDYNTLNWTEDATSPPAGNVLTSIPFTSTAQFNDADLVGRVAESLYFRSNAATGAFETGSNWLVSTDVNFVAPAGVVADAPPTYSNSEGIRIMNGHNITYNSVLSVAMPVDQMTVDNGGTLTIASGSGFVINDGTGVDLKVDGNMVNNNANAINFSAGSPVLQFTSTGLYDHAVNIGTIPAATWDVGSTCLVSGTTTTAPAGLGQAFSDFTWNTPTLAASLNLSSGLTNVGRDLNIVNTNGFTLGLTSTTALALNVGRDLNVSGGILNLVTGANTNAVSMAVTNNVNISNAASFSVAGTASSGVGTVALTVGGAFNNSSTASPSFILNGNSKTTVTSTITGLFTQSGSGTSSLHITTGTGAATLNCNGGLTISAGIMNVANGGPATLNIGAANTLTLSGGTLVGSATAHTSTINANGTVNINSGTLTLATLGTATFNVADAYDFNLNGGTVNIAAGGTGNLNVGLTISASNKFYLNGGTINIASGGIGNLNLLNNCDLSSGNLNSSSGTASIVFKGPGASFISPKYQSFTQGSATFTGSININNGVSANYCSVVFGSNINIGSATLSATNTNAYFDFANYVLTGNAFTQSVAANIATANVDGFNAAGAIGSVQTSTRSYNASGSFIYSGTSAQVTGTGTANAFTISAFNPAGVTLSQSTVIAGVSGGAVINYGGYAGKLYLGNFDLTLTAGATVVNTPFSPAYYIVTNGTGKLIQTVGASNITYMIGNSAYNPIVLNNTGTSDTYGVRVIDAVTSPAPNDATKLINRYWDITEGVAGGSTLAVNDITPTYNAGEENANFAAGTTLKMGYNNGSGWSDVTATSTGSGPYDIDNNSTISPTVTNYTIGIGKDDGFVNPSTTYTWNGSVSSAWTDPANWTPVTSTAGVGPTLADNVIVNIPGTNTLNITGSRGVTDFDLSGTGTFNISAAGSLTINGNFTYTSSATPTFDCASTLVIASTSSQTIPAFNYGSLNATGGARVLASSGTIGICGLFTPGAGAYTITGSTIDYNGPGTQTIAAFNYNNLSISNNRGGATITLAAGTIDVAGTFNPSLTSYVGVVSGNTFNFSGSAGQAIPAFTYNNITSANLARTWANTGIIDVNGTFTIPATGLQTVTGSTVRYSSTAAGTVTLASFTSSASPRHYHNLEIVGGASSSWNLASGFNMGCAGNFDLTGAGTFTVAVNTTANTMTVDGNLTLSGTGNIIIANTATAALVNSLTVAGNTTISNGLFTCVGASSNTTVQGNLTTNNLTISGTGAMLMEATGPTTAFATVTVNGNMNVTSTAANAVNFGSGTNTAGNVFNLKGNLTKSGTGTFGCTGTFNPTSGFFFNLGSGTQQLSYTGTPMTASNFTVAANSTLQLTSSFSLGSNASASSLNTTGNGILDFGTNVVSAGNAANAFSLSSTGTFKTANTAGVGGSLSGFTVANCLFASGATFDFNGFAPQNTGVTTFTDITTAKAYTINWNGTTSLTLDKSWNTNAFNFTNSGLIFMGNFDIFLPSSAGALTGSGFGVGKMFVTNGTGILSRAVLSGGTGLPFTWPIGENTGTTEYSPVTIASLSSGGISGSIAFRVVDGVHPNMSPAIVYASRYWPCTVSGYNATYTLGSSTFTYVAGDIVGTESLLKGNIYNSTLAFWTELATSSAASNVLTISSGLGGSIMPTGGTSATYDITPRVDVPTYYQSVGAGGNWNVASNWQVADNLSFTGAIAASVAPTNLNSSGIFIRSGSPITVSTAVTADQLTIDASATLTVGAATLTIANGTGTDVLVNGTLLLNSASANLTVNTSATIQVDGIFRESTAAPTIANSGVITIGATGTYEHNINSGTIPQCTWTAGTPGATCLINNVGLNFPTGFNQTNPFYNLTINCPAMGGNIGISGALTAVTNNFTIISTNNNFLNLYGATGTYNLVVGGNLEVQATGGLDFSNAAGTVGITINGNFIQSGGTVRQSGGATTTYNFNGNFNQTAGSFTFNTISATTVANFRGDFTNNGTFARGSGTATLNFIKASGTQNFSQTGGTITGLMPWNIGNGTTTNTVKLLTDFNVGNSAVLNFTLNNLATLDFQDKVLIGSGAVFSMGATSTIKIGSAFGITTSGTGATSGNIQTSSRTVNAAGNFIYHGTVNQLTGNLLPTNITGTLTIANTGTSGNNTVTLTTNNTTTSQLNLTSGLFAIGTGQTMIISSLGTVNQSGTGDFAVGATGGMLRFSTNGGSFTGTCNPFSVETNGANCGVNFGTGTVTIQSGGVFNINTGGFVSSNAPAYAIGSSLWYLTGGNYGRGLEWSASSGKGYPHHVVVAGSTTLNPASAAAVNAAVPFRCGGNLTISSGANIYMDFGGNNMTVPLIVNGNINLVGNLSGSGAIGGDIELKGNWNNNGAAVVNFFPNSRAVTFNGTANQNIGGTNLTANPFAFLTISNAAGVTLTAYQVEVNNQLTLTSGKITLGNFNLKLNGLNTPLTGASASNYIICNGTGSLIRNFNNTATLYPVGPDASTYAPVTMQQSGTADDIAVRVRVAPAFSFAVNDNNQMVNLEWIMNESVAGGNNLVSNFQWPLSSEAAGFIRANGVFQGDYTGTVWQARASIVSGGNPYLSSSSVNFSGSLSNRPFVIGNINGIIGCIATIAPGSWFNTATWSGGNVPVTASAACISHAVQIVGGNTAAISTLTLNAGGSLDIDVTRSLVFNATGGTLTNSTGAANTITGLGSIIFNGTGTIAGGNALSIYSAELNGLTTLSTPLTVNGELKLNTGSSVSATPTYGASSTLIYNTGGTYNVGVEWTGNSTTAGLGIPNNVNIRNTTTLNMPATNRGMAGTLSIEAGTLSMGAGDLYINGDWTRNGTFGTFIPNNKAIFFTRNGTQNITVTGGGTETFNYLVLDKPGGSLVLNSTDVTHITVNGNAGNTLQIINAGSLDLNGNMLNLTNAGGSILASGGIRNIISTLPNALVNVLAAKSVTSGAGGTLVFAPNVKVALSAGMNFGNTLSTIQGTLQIAFGGFVNTNPPTYDIGSTLRYFSGSNYGRGAEWSAASGPGYPYHVDIDENGTVTTLDLSNGGSALRQIAGNLTLNQGGNLSMGAMTNPLVVKGNVSIGGATTGSLTLSSAAGGDIQIGGNLTRNAGGTFTQNGREVTMNGTALQTISSNISSFAFLNIDNNGSSVQISSNTAISNRLRLSNGLFNLNGFNVTMANGSQIRRSAATATMSAAPTINLGNVVDMRYDATMTSGVEFIQDLNKIRDLEITAGTLTIDQNKTINRDLILSGGDLNLATFTFTDRGNIAAPSFAGSITVSGGGTRLITGSLGSAFDITGLGGNSPTLYTKTVSTFGGTLLSFDSNVLVRIGDGAVDFGAGNPTTVNGILQVMLGGSVGQILNPCYYGTNSILRFANTVDYQVGLNDKTWAAGAIASGNPGIPWNVEVNDVGTDLQMQNTRALRGNLTITNGTFTLTPAYTGTFALGGNWTRTGASSSFTHNNKKVVFDRQIAGNQNITVNTGVSTEVFYDVDMSPDNGNVVLNGNVRALNSVGLVTGKVDLNGYTFTVGNTAVDGTITGGSATEYFISGATASKLIRFTTTAFATYAYPVGDAGNYTPMAVQLYAGPMGTTSQVSVDVVASPHPNLGTSTNYLSRYWQVEPSNFPTPQTGYGVTYTWAAADETTAPIPANLKPFKYNPQGWIAANGSGAVFEMGTGTVNPGTRTITWDGLYSFSDFTGNGNGSPLPINLLDFDAVPVLDQVSLTWTTASETNNDYFTVERSKDGINFNNVIMVDGAGNSNSILNYKAMDSEPYEGISYYRLKQTDFDGNFEYSDIKTVNFMKPVQGQSWSVYPNPSSLNGIYLSHAELSGTSLQLSLCDVTGKQVYSETIIANDKGGQQFISFGNLSTGIYYLTIVDGDQSRTMKLVLNAKP